MLRFFITSLFLVCFVSAAFAQETKDENAVKAYYEGFENHNWNTVADQFAKGFTFTSPNNDDHISIERFKEKCWPTNRFFKKVRFIKMIESGNEVFLLVEIFTTQNEIVRNIDYYKFNNEGKIKSIEVFFGAGAKYPGNPK